MAESKIIPYQLIIVDDEGRHEIKAVAIIAFEEKDNKQVVLRMFDNPLIPESWWRFTIKQMCDGLDKAMLERQERFKDK